MASGRRWARGDEWGGLARAASVPHTRPGSGAPGPQGLGRQLAGVHGHSLGEDTSPEPGPVAQSRPRPLGATGRKGSLNYKAS